MTTFSPALLKERKDAWIAVAEKIYEKRKAYVENVAHVQGIFEEEEELLSPLVKDVLALSPFSASF